MKILAKIILPLGAIAAVFIFLLKFSFFSEKRTLDFSGEKTMTINDDGLEHTVSTKAKNVASVLAENKINLSEKDEVFPMKETEVLPGMTVFINRPAKVKISVDGETFEKTTFAKNVAQ